MKRIYYTSGSVLTGDRTADAIVSYAEALAVHESSAAIEIPIVLDDGRTARAQLLIGPASQLVVVPEGQDHDPPEDQDTIDKLARQTRMLASPRPQASESPDGLNFPEGDEYSDVIEGRLL